MGHEVQVEPRLQPITGEHFPLASLNIEDGAHLNISVNGFWGGRSERTFLDVKVFNPYAVCNSSATPRGIYRCHENMKNGKDIREVEHVTFTPLIFSATGGMADEACAFYKHLASLLCD